MMRLHLYDRVGTQYLGFLDAAADKRYLAELNGVGAGSFVLNAADPKCALVAPQNLVRVDVGNTTVGWWVIERIKETLVQPGELAANTVEVSGRGLLALLERALVYAFGYPIEPGTDTELPFAPSFGGGWFDLLNSNVDLPFGFSFDDTDDSNGDAWPGTIATSFKCNTSMLDVAEFMGRMGYEWRLSADREMDAYISAGDDLTDTVIFRQGRDVEYLSQETFSGELANAVMAIQGKASYVAYVESTSVAQYGRLETPLNTSDETDQSKRAEILRDLLAYPRVTYELAVNTATFTPFTDYNLGDTILLWTNRVRDDFRVKAIQIAQDNGPLLKVDLTLDDRLMTYMERVNASLRRLEMRPARLYGIED